MTPPALDLSFVYTASDNDPTYIYNIVSLYIDTAPKGLLELEKLVKNTNDYAAMARQAHFLKSSANIVKVRDMYADLVVIEAEAKLANGKETIMPRLEQIIANLNEAMPLLKAEQKKCKPKKAK